MRRLAFGVVALGMLHAGPAHAQSVRHAAPDLPEYSASDPSAAAITAHNLLASERFWPYRVSLTRAWKPAGGGTTLDAQTVGVLIRVEDAGGARIDFGRNGLHEVPVDATDLLARANEIRLGKLDKTAPNFVLAIGPRLVDSRSTPIRPLPIDALTGRQRFLAVFADPASPEFAELAKALGPLRERPGLETIFFPQGRVADAVVHERLAALGWTVPFVFDHLSEAYTPSLLGDGAALPALTLQTDEGRLLYRGAWGPNSAAELTAALDRG